MGWGQAMNGATWFTIIGLVLTLAGAGCGAYGAWIKQDRFVVGGYVLIGLGAALQIVGFVLSASFATSAPQQAPAAPPNLLPGTRFR
jgi:hypothetical protein